MAGAIHKMAVYLGLVEDEVAFEDGYDSFEEDYAGYEDEELAASAVAAYGVAANGSARQPAAAGACGFRGRLRRVRSRLPRYGRPPISPGSRRCIRAHTMRPARSVSTSAKAPRSS